MNHGTYRLYCLAGNGIGGEDRTTFFQKVKDMEKGYKAFNQNMACIGFQYEIGKGIQTNDH